MSLHHVVRQPKKVAQNPPMLLMLHGYGSNELDLFSFAEELQDELLIVSARAPMDMVMGGYAWYTIHWDANDGKMTDEIEALASLLSLHEFISELQTQYQPSKTFLMGFSQGAILSYAISINYPNQVDYVIAMSGYLNPVLQPDTLPDTLKTSYYISHGAVDQVIPVNLARKAPPVLQSLGLEVAYSEYPVGHGVAPQNFYHCKEWIQERL